MSGAFKVRYLSSDGTDTFQIYDEILLTFASTFTRHPLEITVILKKVQEMNGKKPEIAVMC